MPRPKKPVEDKVISVRLPLPLLEKVRLAKKMMPGYSEQDIIRMATAIGLIRLKRIGYQIAEVLDSASEKIISVPDELPKATEDAAPYKAGSKAKPKPGGHEPPKQAAG